MGLFLIFVGVALLICGFVVQIPKYEDRFKGDYAYWAFTIGFIMMITGSIVYAVWEQ